MPLLQETKAAAGERFKHCDSRSLLLERFADPTLKGDERREFFRLAIDKPAASSKREVWREFLLSGLGLELNDLLFTQLQARLMVNMAGGVMENAGLCLDRFGIPYIPGSAVKGCARRMVIQTLLETPADKKAELLFNIALVFGWSDLEWRLKTDLRPKRDETDQDFQKRWEKERSDFAFACGDDTWPKISDEVMVKLTEHLRLAVTRDKRGRVELPSYAGTVCFLPAYPVDLGKTGKVNGLPLEVPQLGKLELDVVTCHHREYYARKLQEATDTEEPNPVVFPAVAPGHVFAFAVVPLRGCSDELLNQGRNWLKQGLETFGLGAKTNAGYGWFDASDATQKKILAGLVEEERKRVEEKKRQEEQQRRKAEEEERRRKAAEQKAATANLTPEQKADYELAQLTDDQFRGRLDNFTKREPEEQKAIVRALRLPADQPKTRRKFWDELKAKAQKGGKPAQIEQAIRTLSKQMFPGKEGKMP